MEPPGLQAQLIDIVWLTMLWVCGFMYVLVIGFLAFALLRRRGSAADEGPPPAPHPGLSRTLAAWGALILLGLGGLFAASLIVDRALARTAVEPGVRLKIEAQQWWWAVEYESTHPQERIRTANEIHIPVDTPVEVTLESRDVIHSFWVPALHGKVDLIPDRSNAIRLHARRLGRFRGQCAEFCGLQHAHMAVEVVVHPVREYRAWLAREHAPAPAPVTALQRAGREAFLGSACPACHTVAGTPARGAVGPDLTHVGGRRTIGAGTLPLTRANLARWIENSQRFKPGNRMPPMPMSARERDAIAAWLSTLR